MSNTALSIYLTLWVVASVLLVLSDFHQPLCF